MTHGQQAAWDEVADKTMLSYGFPPHAFTAAERVAARRQRMKPEKAAEQIALFLAADLGCD